MKKTKPFLSVIIPVYNETKRLGTLPKIINFFKKQKFASELILVNDGSKDDTLEKIKNLQKKGLLRIITYKKNRGKGYAIKKGMLAANGKYNLFLDIDLSTPLGEFKKFLPYLNKYDILIGSRKTKGAKLIVHQPPLRENMGKAFTYISQIALQLPISDFTCGFKCFSHEAKKEIFKRQKIERWSFDSEILFIGNKLGFPIKEIPVVWKNDLNTKVKFPQDIINSIRDLIRIRINQLRGAYQPKSSKA